MAAACTLVCCKEESETDKAVVVQFSNGNLESPGQLDYTFYKNIDERNPRKKARRTLVAESERLSYAGHNFGTGSLKCNNLCKYYVGVLNKRTMQMELHSAQLFKLQPIIPGEKTETDTSQDVGQTYRQKVDSLIEAFGTVKQKRALSSRRLNQVGSDTLHHMVSKTANDMIDQKGLEVLQQEVAQTQSQDVAVYLPPCHPNAERPEDVYLFDDLLSPVEFEALGEGGSKMAALTPKELQKMRDDGGCLSVVKQVEILPSDDKAKEKTVRCAYYLYLLLKLVQERRISRKFFQKHGCPPVIQNKLMNTFTVDMFNDGKLLNIVSASMCAKVASHGLALLLHVGHMTADLTLLHRDLGITEPRMLEVAKAMGLTISKNSHRKANDAVLTDGHRRASLILPLVKYEQYMERKRLKKKMR
ncbi:DNA-directed RNA polymerase I subunit RPA49 [Lampris incognitus]|uniref:DNA-directed RNA polymerase I subunit RPA49 n=1 Tax=Lampris incognitus TaxID=2546036 RepID=UPI0024B56474|nr:DNA-directed RNA polymerase I subunit RPA49 [Lampris incognitus]XP_056136762.1 DNA-directed RNA polymerase I subunit RPA49 [Lampris incognitus]